MKKIVIVAALKKEIEILKNRVDHLEEINLGQHTAYKGQYGINQLVFSVSGVGKVNAAITTQKLIDIFSPDYVINIGIAGALQEDLKVLDTVIAEDLTYHDFSHKFMKSYYPYIDKFVCSKVLLNKSKDLFNNIKYGSIISGDQFIDDQKIKAALVEKYQALCVEMEGASIAHTAYANDIPFLVIRTISDLANDQAQITYDQFEQEAADKSCELVLTLISQI